MTEWDPELVICPPTGEFCPFLDDCQTAQLGAEAEQQRIADAYLELTAGRVEDTVQTEIAQQMGVELLPEAEGSDQWTLGRLARRLGRSAGRAEREADAYEASLEQLSSHLDVQIEQARSMAAETREICPGGPETRKRWGLFGREMLVCADPRNQNILYDKPEEL